MKAYLDNLLITEPSESLRNPVITQQRISDTGDIAFSFTGELEFNKESYTYLYAKLVNDPNALENRVTLRMVDDCCSQGFVYEFTIDHQSLRWCEDSCTMTASAKEKSLSVDQYTCFKNTIIWDDRLNFQSKQHPRMAYCNELRPNWLHDVMIILIIATWTSFLTIGPILIVVASIINTINFLITNVINPIIDAINALGGSLDNVDEIDIDGDPATNAFQELNNWVNQLINQSFGCGRKHPSPLVRDYIQNVCNICGVAFQSSIYNNSNSAYYNTVYVNAPIDKGTTESDTTTYWIPDNAPILSGLQLLDQLSPVHNAKFRIKNSTLYYERRDFFVPSTPWLDLTTYDKTKIVSICWEWSQKTRPSYAKLEYQKDGINWVGGEAIARWRDYVEWNPQSSYSPLQKGEYAPNIQFAACRFRNDGIDRDVLTFYENFPTVGPLLKKYNHAMLMNSHNCFTPMLLVWDGQSVENASCDNFVNVGATPYSGANQAYNYPFWFKEDLPGNLYEYHAIENPRSSNFQGFDFVAEIQYDCNLLSLIDIDGVVKTSRGDSKEPLIITIDRAKGVLIIKGTV